MDTAREKVIGGEGRRMKRDLRREIDRLRVIERERGGFRGCIVVSALSVRSP